MPLLEQGLANNSGDLSCTGPAGSYDGSGTENGKRFGVTETAHHGDERTTLLGVLQRQRDLIAWKFQGAPDQVLAEVATPSGMDPHGLVRHLTNVERSWLRDVFASEHGLHYDWTDEDPDAEWRVPTSTTMTELLTDYAEESRRCDAVAAATDSLDATSASRDMSLRWILLHLVEETARHLGHLDLLREQADGGPGQPRGPARWSRATAAPATRRRSGRTR
ncbi:MAG: DinB family protein [Rhodoglobus sp.]